ncbi:hypothetical protein ACR6C2_37455 [Streptomyces sp. INA 01156]
MFRVLGSVEAEAGGRAVTLGGAKQRTVLAAMLLAGAGRSPTTGSRPCCGGANRPPRRRPSSTPTSPGSGSAWVPASTWSGTPTPTDWTHGAPSSTGRFSRAWWTAVART